MSDLLPPSADFAAFDEKGYRFVAKFPAGPAERTEFAVSVARADPEQPLFTYTVPMLYAPVFGVDAGDRASLEHVTDLMIARLPAAADFSPDTFAALTADPALQNVRLAAVPPTNPGESHETV